MCGVPRTIGLIHEYVSHDEALFVADPVVVSCFLYHAYDSSSLHAGILSPNLCFVNVISSLSADTLKTLINGGYRAERIRHHAHSFAPRF